MKPIAIVLLALAVVGFGAGTAQAQLVSPLQSGHYIPNVMNMRDLSTPTPGLALLWYNDYWTGDTFYDQHGDKFNQINLKQLAPRLPNVAVSTDAHTFTTIPTAVWAADSLILGGARYFATLSVPYLAGEGSLGGEHGGGAVIPAGGRSASGSVSGISDISVSPIGLSWTFPKFDVTGLYTVYAPTGEYEVGGSNNTGLGYWTNQAQLFGYYYPGGNRSTALLLGLTYEINGTIKDTEVKPGNRFTVQYGIDHYFTERLLVGLEGSYNKQVSDDTGGGVYWDPGVHDQKSTIGVSAGYWVWPDRLQITAKYWYDYSAEQRFGGQGFGLNFAFITDKLTGRK